MSSEIPNQSLLGKIFAEGYSVIAGWCVAALLVVLWPIAKLIHVIYGPSRPQSESTELRHAADDREIYVGLVLRALNYGSSWKWKIGRLLHGIAKASKIARAELAWHTSDTHGDYPEYVATTATDVFGGYSTLAQPDSPLQGDGCNDSGSLPTPGRDEGGERLDVDSAGYESGSAKITFSQPDGGLGERISRDRDGFDRCSERSSRSLPVEGDSETNVVRDRGGVEPPR